MKKNTTVLYAMSAALLADPDIYCAAYAAVSEERRKKTDGYRFDKDKYLSLGAGLLLQNGLREAGADPKHVRITKNAQGKPYLNDAGLFFNLSHSGDRVICAMSSVEVGCDIEKIRHAEERIAMRFFCPEEYRHIAVQTDEESRDLLFTRYWTLKESFLKATGLGMLLPLDSFRIVPGEPAVVEQTADPRSFFFTEIRDIPAYCCAVCTAGNDTEIIFKEIGLPSLQ